MCFVVRLGRVLLVKVSMILDIPCRDKRLLSVLLNIVLVVSCFVLLPEDADIES